jgi:hypothetical protein
MQETSPNPDGGGPPEPPLPIGSAARNKVYGLPPKIVSGLRPNFLSRERVEQLINRDRWMKRLLVRRQQILDRPLPDPAEAKAQFRRVEEEYQKFAQLQFAQAYQMVELAENERRLKQRALEVHEAAELRMLRRLQKRAGVRFVPATYLGRPSPSPS